jgi:hypothetical protein
MKSLHISLKILSALYLLAVFPVLAAEAEDSERFKQIYEKEWAFRLQEFPLFASYAGVHDYADMMGHVSEADQLRRNGFWKGIRSQLNEISCARLEREECINYRVFVKQMDHFIAGYVLPDSLYQ